MSRVLGVVTSKLTQDDWVKISQILDQSHKEHIASLSESELEDIAAGDRWMANKFLRDVDGTSTEVIPKRK